MAGGNFDINIGKVRPGTYVNVKGSGIKKSATMDRGIALIPLVGYDWGPDGELLSITDENKNKYTAKLGRSMQADNSSILMIREMLKKAKECLVYIIAGGVKASAVQDELTIKAVYGGELGNSLKVTSTANAVEGVDVIVYMNSNIVESYEGVKTIKDLIAKSTREYVEFSTGDTAITIPMFASISLKGGKSEDITNAKVIKFLDSCDYIKFNTMAFPVTDSELQIACIEKILSLRSNNGKCVQAVIPNCKANSEGIINVTNSIVVGEKKLSVSEACAWVAGATAGADKLTSNTYVEYEGATAVVDEKTNEEAEKAILNGEFFFSKYEGKVIVEYDINSLHTFSDEKTEDYRKNKVVRVYDTFTEDLQKTFPPNKFKNNEQDWRISEGLGRALLQRYEEEGAIKNVDLEADFYVDVSRSEGDSTYYYVGIQAVDQSEKLYFSVTTR